MSTDLAVVEGTVAALPSALSEGKARQLDKRIRLACIRVNDEAASLFDLLEEASVGQIHVALGMSWKDWWQGSVNIAPADASERKALVSMMAGRGYSQRQIAELAGVNQATISRDLQGDANASTGVTIGSDNKTYPREKPAKPDIIDAEVIEESLEEKLARVAAEAEEAEEWDEPEEPRKATDVISDFGENMDYLMPAVQAFTDQLADDAELFPKARKRIAKSHLNQLQAMIADLQLVVDELMEE